MAVPSIINEKEIEERRMTRPKEMPKGILPRKIRTLPASFQGIRAKWKKYRLSKLEEKLNSSKNNILNAKVEIDSKYYMPAEDPKQDKKLFKRAEKIAKLEAKISLVKEKKKWTKRQVGRRAIVLYNNMIANLRYNTEGYFSFADDLAEDEIFGTQKPIVSDSKEEEEQVVPTPEELRKKILESAGKAEEQPPKKELSIIPNPSYKGELDLDLNKGKEEKNTNSLINEDGTYTISGKDLIDHRWVAEKKVSTNGSSAAKINQFATPESRIIVMPEASPVNEKSTQDTIEKKEERRMPELIPTREEKFQFENKAKSEEPAETVKNLNDAIDNASSIGDVHEILKQIKELKEKNASTKEQAKQAKERTASVKKEYDDTCTQLLDYQAALMEDNDFNLDVVRKQQEEEDRLKLDIEAMRQAMGPIATVSNIEENRGKGK